ncbi:MAG: FRG domain-containing protein [Planctomycetes bacterium]|nr:FRG domain-containing protein [Planctomycetota bacterium]
MNWKAGDTVDGVVEVEADSWNGFVSYVQDELANYRAYIFRGQREPEWQLVPSIDRIQGLAALRNDTLSTFKNASRGRRGASPASLTDDEWWALGQHYGLRTPLLDWTASPFVAAFFAFLTKRDISALPKARIVYAIARQQIAKKKAEIERDAPGTFLTGTDAIEILSPQVDDNNRLVSQRGYFTKSLGVHIEIEAWIRKWFRGNTGGIMIKILIMEQDHERDIFLRFLNRMNINHLSLFPDLDGASRYCNMELEIEDY